MDNTDYHEKGSLAEIEEVMAHFRESQLSQYVEVVTEPEYSMKKLLELESEFGMKSEVFYGLYASRSLDKQFPKEKMEEWAYNYRMFVRNGGNSMKLQKNQRNKNQ